MPKGKIDVALGISIIGDDPVVVEEDMRCSIGIDVETDHLAVVVDAGERGRRRARDVDGGEGTVRGAQEAMEDAGGVHVLADDATVVVDVDGLGVEGARDIDGGHDAVLPEKAMAREYGERVDRAVAADDLPAIVDRRWPPIPGPPGCRCR